MTHPADSAVRTKGGRHRGRTIAASVAGILALGVTAVSATGYAVLNYSEAKIKRVDVFAGLSNRPDASGDAVNYLLVGSDSREGLSKQDMRRLHVGSIASAAGRRADTMILVHISKHRDKATLISFPRDLYVTIPAHPGTTKEIVAESKNKLNAAYAYGGPTLAVQTVEGATGIKIDHYVEINFLGFTKMVDAVGGVEVCTPKPLVDQKAGLDLSAGRHELNGENGLKYVRARHLDARADLGRIDRQQEFLGAMLRKATSTGVLLNPVKLTRFVNAGLESVTTDAGLKRADMITLATKLRSLSPKKVTFVTVPIADPSHWVSSGVGAVALANDAAATAMYDDVRADRVLGSRHSAKNAARSSVNAAKPKLTVAPADIRVAVKNAADIKGLGSKAAAALDAAGFDVRGPATTARSSGATRTVIRYDSRYTESVKTLAAALPGATLEKVPGLGRTQQVLVGSTYGGVTKVSLGSSTNSGGVAATPARRTAADNPCT